MSLTRSFNVKGGCGVKINYHVKWQGWDSLIGRLCPYRRTKTRLRHYCFYFQLKQGGDFIPPSHLRCNVFNCPLLPTGALADSASFPLFLQQLQDFLRSLSPPPKKLEGIR